MQKSLYVVLVARESDGELRKLSIPIQFVYVFLAAATIGLFTIVGLAGSYSRMLLKTERFNQLRQEHQTLRRDYARLEKREQEKEVQAASLGALASEVSALYGFTADKLSTSSLIPGHSTRSPKPSKISAAKLTVVNDAVLTNADYYKSLDDFYRLRSSAMSGDTSRALARSLQGSSFQIGAGSVFAGDADTPSIWPVMGYVSSPFGEREDPVLGAGEGEFHKGIDIAAAMGTPIHATAAGRVQMAGLGNGYGREVVVDHGNGVRTIYGHMSAIGCTEGQEVVRGQVIGYVGQSGRATGPHVHYEIRVRDVAVNPHKYLLAAPVEEAALHPAVVR